MTLNHAGNGVGFFILLFLFSLSASGQQKFTISGFVKDASNGESLFSCNVFVKESLQGTTSNEYGFFSLTLPAGTYTLSASFLGFKTWEKSIELNKDLRVNIDMESSAIMKEEIVITDKRKDESLESTDMGKMELSTEQVKALPALLGEVDIMKTIQLLPGIQAAGEGNAGFYVRGGGPDQNLILLDNAVVYNTGHLFGFFSVFNADAIKNTTVIKGGMPANYGGRLSSVLDISMKEGNMKKHQVEGGIGLISSRLTVQGPLKKDKASFMVSGRRTYIDVITTPIFKRVQDGAFSGNTYYFYDLNAKVNYRFSDKDRIYLSGYFGRDVFRFGSKAGGFTADIPWGNSTMTLRWNHLFHSKLFMNATLLYNDYNFRISSGFQDVNFSLFSGVRDWSGAVDFDYYPNIRNHIKFGAIFINHKFTPYSASGTTTDVEFKTDDLKDKFANEAAAYIQDEFDLTDAIKINAGVRFSYFRQVGPFQRVVTNEFGGVIDTLNFAKGEKIKDYAGVEPRLSARYRINSNNSLKAGITMNTQYIHLVSSATATLPTDLWVPSSDLVRPQRGIQYSLGYFKNFKDNTYETSVEVYYKDLRNQIEFSETFAPELNEDLELSFVFGKGWSYGAEFFFKKTYGKLNGWVGYTLAWTERKFPDINNGEKFPARYDRRHDISLVATYDISERWRVSGVFVYATGNATTLPVSRYFIEGKIVNEFGPRNSYRMEAYHRADISVMYMFKIRQKHYSDLTLSVYNLYNRRNPYFYYYDIEGSVFSGDLSVQAKKVSLFPVLPSITWNFKF